METDWSAGQEVVREQDLQVGGGGAKPSGLIRWHRAWAVCGVKRKAIGPPRALHQSTQFTSKTFPIFSPLKVKFCFWEKTKSESSFSFDAELELWVKNVMKRVFSLIKTLKVEFWPVWQTPSLSSSSEFLWISLSLDFWSDCQFANANASRAEWEGSSTDANASGKCSSFDHANAKARRSESASSSWAPER